MLLPETRVIFRANSRIVTGRADGTSRTCVAKAGRASRPSGPSRTIVTVVAVMSSMAALATLSTLAFAVVVATVQNALGKVSHGSP